MPVGTVATMAQWAAIVTNSKQLMRFKIVYILSIETNTLLLSSSLAYVTT